MQSPPCIISDVGSSHLDLEGYRFVKLIGVGAYGQVVKCVNTRHQQDVAIKVISKVSESSHTALKTIREIYLLHSLKHRNILALKSIIFSKKVLYLVTDLIEIDLHGIIYADNNGSICRHNFFKKKSDYVYVLYQMLDAVNYLHCVGVLHRDIKPANILINQKLQIKLCDFGLARLVNACDEYHADGQEPLTEYVVTRWYRAPELFLNPGKYGKAQDVWSVACTFCEIFRRYPLFPGKDTIDQIRVIVDTIGGVTSSDLEFVISPAGRRFMESLTSSGTGLSSAIDTVSAIHPELFDLLTQMLQFNPNLRITAGDAMESNIFHRFHQEDTGEVQGIRRDEYDAYESSVNRKMKKSELIQALQDFTDDIASDIQRQSLDSHFNIISTEMRNEDDRASVTSNITNNTDASMVSFLNAVPEGLNPDGSLAISIKEKMTNSLNVFAEPKANFFPLSLFNRSLSAVAPTHTSTTTKNSSIPQALSRRASSGFVGNTDDGRVVSRVNSSNSFRLNHSSSKQYQQTTEWNSTGLLPSNSSNTNDFLCDDCNDINPGNNLSITESDIFRECQAFKPVIPPRDSKKWFKSVVHNVKNRWIGLTRGKTSNDVIQCDVSNAQDTSVKLNKEEHDCSDCNSNHSNSKSDMDFHRKLPSGNALRKKAVNALEGEED